MRRRAGILTLILLDLETMARSGGDSLHRHTLAAKTGSTLDRCLTSMRMVQPGDVDVLDVLHGKLKR